MPPRASLPAPSFLAHASQEGGPCVPLSQLPWSLGFLVLTLKPTGWEVPCEVVGGGWGRWPCPGPGNHPSSVPMKEGTLGTSHKWNRTQHWPSVTSLFREHGVLKALPCCSLCQNPLFLEAELCSTGQRLGLSTRGPSMQAWVVGHLLVF